MFAVLWLGGCGGNPVEDCKFFPETDCCELSSQCAEFYDDVPYCSRPDRDRGGICSMCLRDDHCRNGEVCHEYSDGFRECIQPDDCYEGTPFTFTSCR